MRAGFLIPVYRHGKTACRLAGKLAAFGLPIILVDDGNDSEDKTTLEEYAAVTSCVVLVRLEANSGKGGAVIAGFEKAAEQGLTHVLQIDADGQHDLDQVSFFLEEAARRPESIICGYPRYDHSAPPGRVVGRKIANFWAAVVTLSGELRDVLCGFRVYPVEPAVRITKKVHMDRRMGFDAEILVRLYWSRVFPVFYPVKVNYPQDGISNFHVVRDNIRISWMFTRLCIGMFPRLPLLIIRAIQRGKKRP